MSAYFCWPSFGAICLVAILLPPNPRGTGWRVQLQHRAPLPYSCQNYCIWALAYVSLNSTSQKKGNHIICVILHQSLMYKTVFLLPPPPSFWGLFCESKLSGCIWAVNEKARYHTGQNAIHTYLRVNPTDYSGTFFLAELYRNGLTKVLLGLAADLGFIHELLRFQLLFHELLHMTKMVAFLNRKTEDANRGFSFIMIIWLGPMFSSFSDSFMRGRYL